MEAVSICRSCMTILCNTKFNLIQTPQLAELYIRLSSTNLDIEDPLPKYICSPCYQLLKDFDSFQTMCLQSYKNLLFRFPVKVDVKEEHFEEIVKNEQSEIVFNEGLEQSPTEDVDNASSDSEDAIQSECDPLRHQVGTSTTENMEEIVKQELPDAKQFDSEDELLADLAKRETRHMRKVSTKAKSKHKNANLGVKRKNTKWPRNKNSTKDKTEVRPFACNQCPKTFLQQHLYDGHLRKHQGLKPHACKQCDKSFDKITRLSYHMQADHIENPTRYPCTIEGCDKDFKSKDIRKKHVRSHLTPKDDKRPGVVCELCGKVLTTKSNLQRHMLLHKKEFPFTCEICSKKFRARGELNVHKMKHQGIKKFACEICGLKKTTQHDVNVHMNVHTRKKTYPCKLCSSHFLSYMGLSRHHRIHHLGIKDYACTHCDQRFGKAETLKYHIMTHTGEKPHECSICGKRFIQPTAFQYHVKRHQEANRIDMKRAAVTENDSN